ncbi:hypothetical protein [Allofustis seminis]|uniref:hypothetical protein n=1 Tax=Allofustis seminis TaxID=166939 RepID=UPI00036AD29C|nr:hypothetical protein [Allofustis seminis]
MSKFVGEKTTYYVVRLRKGEEKEQLEQLLQVSRWDGSVYWTTEYNNATEFEEQNRAEEAAKMQEMFMKFTGIDCEMKVLQKDEITKFVALKMQG